MRRSTRIVPALLAAVALVAACSERPELAPEDESAIRELVMGTKDLKERSDVEGYRAALTPEARAVCFAEHIGRMLRLEETFGRAYAPGVFPAPGQQLEVWSRDEDHATVPPPQVQPALAQLRNTSVRVARTSEGWRIELSGGLMNSCVDGIFSSEEVFAAFLATYPMVASATVTHANFEDDFDRVPFDFADSYSANFSEEFKRNCRYDPFLQLVISPDSSEVLSLEAEQEESNWRAVEGPDEVEFLTRDTNFHVMIVKRLGSDWEITEFLGRSAC